MLELFLMFNSIVLESFTSILIVIGSTFVLKLAQGLFIVSVIIILPTLFTSAPFIPTRKKIFSKMFEFADVKPGDKVYDLGCGEGRFLFEAERRGAHATGIEMNIGIYLLALFNKKRLGSKSTIIRDNLHHVNLKDADVVFCFLAPPAMKKLDFKFKRELKKGCKIVCNTFRLPEWDIEKEYIDDSIRVNSVFMYVV